jgi:rod shape determining protein RodA
MEFSSFEDYSEEFNAPSALQANNVMDWAVILISSMLIALGLISIYSATYDAGMSEYFTKQAVFAGIGAAAMVGLMFIPERWIYQLSYILYGISIVLLIAVIFIGKTVYGSKSWLALGPITFQPSELGKIGTLMAVAKFLSQKGRDLRTLRDMLSVLGIIGLPIMLIMLEPDFGSASVYATMMLGIFFWAGADLFLLYLITGAPLVAIAGFIGREWFFAAAGIFSALSFSFKKGIALTATACILFLGVGFSSNYVYGILKPHQKDRIQTFLNPDNDPRGKGYHVIQSIMAVGSGGITGKGFLQGTQTQLRYIPKQWTDFIFCVPTEEFGFIGGLAVIGLLGTLVFQCVNIASSAGNIFGSVISASVGILLFYHTVVNIGMAIGLFPVMGIPLPFLSAGGSSLVMNMGCIGLVLNVYRNRRRAKRK